MKFAHWLLRIAILSGILIGGYDQATAGTIYMTAREGNQIVALIGELQETQQNLIKLIEMAAEEMEESKRQILTLQEDIVELQLHAIAVQKRDMAEEAPAASSAGGWDL